MMAYQTQGSAGVDVQETQCASEDEAARVEVRTFCQSTLRSESGQRASTCSFAHSLKAFRQRPQKSSPLSVRACRPAARADLMVFLQRRQMSFLASAASSLHARRVGFFAAARLADAPENGLVNVAGGLTDRVRPSVDAGLQAYLDTCGQLSS